MDGLVKIYLWLQLMHFAAANVMLGARNTCAAIKHTGVLIPRVAALVPRTLPWANKSGRPNGLPRCDSPTSHTQTRHGADTMWTGPQMR